MTAVNQSEQDAFVLAHLAGGDAAKVEAAKAAYLASLPRAHWQHDEAGNHVLDWNGHKLKITRALNDRGGTVWQGSIDGVDTLGVAEHSNPIAEALVAQAEA